MDNYINIYQKRLKENIKELINKNKLKEAREILTQYEGIVKDDIDIYSIKGIIAMMEGDVDQAEVILIDGLKVEPFNSDILYNLGYVSEMTNKKDQAIECYKQVFQNTDSVEVRDEVYGILQRLGVREGITKDLMSNKDKTTILEKNILENKKVAPITIMTKVYNSKDYIHQCVKSVLNQTFKDFEWVILDNGCTDGTSEILLDYAKKDKRIKLFISELNNLIYELPDEPSFSKYLYNVRSEYMCSVDSDDILDKDFLKTLYETAKKHEVDVVVGGTEMFDDQNHKLRSRRNPPDFYVKNIKDMGDIFPEIYGCFRPVWGKLVRSEIYINARKDILNNNTKILNGGDTMISLEILANSKDVVGVDKSLYYHRIRKTSFYHSHSPKYRYLDYVKIYEKSIKLLKSWGKFDHTNKKFIGSVLYHSIKDCINIATNAGDLTMADRIEIINIILSDFNVIQIASESGLLVNLLNDITGSINILINREKSQAKV